MIATATGIETVVNFVTMSGMIAGLIAMTGTAIVMIAGCMNNGEPTGMDIAGFTKTKLTLESEKRGALVLRFFIGGNNGKTNARPIRSARGTTMTNTVR